MSRLTCVAAILGQVVPLVDGYHQRPAGLEDEPGHVRVLVGDVLARVEHQDHHLRILDRLQGLDDRELLGRLVDLSAASQPGRVDQGVGAPGALEIDVDAVAGGAGLVEGDDPVFAEDGVDQRRLADVGTPDHRDLRPARLHFRLRLRPPRTAPEPAPAGRSRHRRAPPRSPRAGPARARETRRWRSAEAGPRSCSPPATGVAPPCAAPARWRGHRA